MQGEAWSVDGGFALSKAVFKFTTGGFGIPLTMLRTCHGAIVEGSGDINDYPLGCVCVGGWVGVRVYVCLLVYGGRRGDLFFLSC